MCLSVVLITELRYGIERLARGKRRDVLEAWLRNDLSSRFEGRILSVDSEVADTCVRLVARSESVGHPIEPRDAFIAATAEVYGVTLVHRQCFGLPADREVHLDSLDLSCRPTC